MTKLLGKMTVGGKLKRSLAESSDDEEEEMQVDTDPRGTAASKGIKKKNRKSRAYYEDLKKTLRRKVKSGIPLGGNKLDEQIAKLKEQMGVS